MKMYDLAYRLSIINNIEGGARRFLEHPGPRRLRISCLVIPVRLQRFAWTDGQTKRRTELAHKDTGEHTSVSRELENGFHPVVQVWEGIYVTMSPSMDQDVNPQDCVLGLLFAKHHLFPAEYGCLLVRQMEEGLCERIGLITWTEPWWMFEPAIFLDAMDNILDEVTVSAKAFSGAFTDFAERRTVCLA